MATKKLIIQSYAPILRWKLAERGALKELDNEVRKELTPVFEFIMPGPKRDKADYRKVLEDSKTVLKKRMPKMRSELNKCHPKGVAFVDVHLIDGDLRAQTFREILYGRDKIGVTLIPTTYIIPVNSTEADIAIRKIAVEYAHTNDNGLCIRIDRISLQDPALADIINDFIRDNQLGTSEIDLLVDLGIVEPHDSAEIITPQLLKLPNLMNWRSFIIAGGAFPKDLVDVEKHSQIQIPRLDRNLWNKLRAQKGLRKPTFSDYTIQHPIHYGEITAMNTSASIRYTDETVWEVSRGEGLRNEKGAGYKQYPLLARVLTEQNFFKGADYSPGDSYIADRAKLDNKLTGNPRTWLKAGITHHLTLVVKQNGQNS